MRQNHAAFASDDTDEAAFANSMRESDAPRATVERERLELERDKMRLEAEERKKDRKECAKVWEQERGERKADREAHSELDLKKFKLMLESLSSVNKWYSSFSSYIEHEKYQGKHSLLSWVTACYVCF